MKTTPNNELVDGAARMHCAYQMKLIALQTADDAEEMKHIDIVREATTILMTELATICATRASNVANEIESQRMVLYDEKDCINFELGVCESQQQRTADA